MERKEQKKLAQKKQKKKKLLKSSAGNVVCEFSELQNRLEFLNLRVQLRTLYVSQSLGPILHLNLQLDTLLKNNFKDSKKTLF